MNQLFSQAIANRTHTATTSMCITAGLRVPSVEAPLPATAAASYQPQVAIPDYPTQPTSVVRIEFLDLGAVKRARQKLEPHHLGNSQLLTTSTTGLLLGISNFGVVSRPQHPTAVVPWISQTLWFRLETRRFSMETTTPTTGSWPRSCTIVEKG